MDKLELVVDWGIIGVLAVMGFLSLFIWIERMLFFRSVDINQYRLKDELELDLSRGLTLMANISANAPFIGLLGTVLGIMLTFYSLGESGAIEIKTIMVGLALALKATALGLVIAIPTTIIYNQLIRKIEILLTKWTIETQKN